VLFPIVAEYLMRFPKSSRNILWDVGHRGTVSCVISDIVWDFDARFRKSNRRV
jgi:hypothetical protein